ncbi:5-formyltetrahydrofolate cyclo-ligase [Micromonospora sp. NPDC049679]|uniref:5-formyltetrahydrofolate cyclo-ligase n=1 Tax=Micromonospora sp. NPDC049679 TaxID=3155920 RepID=UPI0033FC24B9
MSDFRDDSHAARPAKARLRADILRRRRALPAEARAAAAAQVQVAVADLIRRFAPRCVAGYAPVGSEPGGPDLPDVLATAVGPGGRVLLPVLRSDLDLDWAGYVPGSPLPAAGRGLREPAGARLGAAAIGDAELVVVPAVAVDGRGVRLGRGGGSYDRALARVGRGVLTVALLHDGELVETVPAEAHDHRVRAVIMPGGLRPLSP